MLAFFCVNYLNERGFYLIFFFFLMLRSKRGLYDRRLEIYKIIPPAEDSLGVDSKE